LLIALGAKVTEGNGSRKRITLNSVRALKSYLVISGMVDDQGNVT